LWLVLRSGKLTHAGDNLYQKHGTAASWADGTYIVLGEDSIDFDMTLKEVNESKRTATLQIRHVPPKQSQVHLPATWMQRPVADTPNNWINVTKGTIAYTAAVGKETFDVELQVSLIDGKILFGTISNLVTAEERDCQDEALASCGNPRPRQISRQIELRLIRQ
jgi:hypothetical protein